MKRTFARGLLHTAAPIPLHIQFDNAVRFARFRAFLNRREITGRFARVSNSACLFSACDLVADVYLGDGLVEGRNELEVEVYSGAGRQTVRRVFMVTDLVANAGQDLR